MNMTGPFVLKHDVQLLPCAQLSEEMRVKLAAEDGDYTVSHKHGRTLAQVVDGDTAALLSLFREPRTLVEAVVESSRNLGRDPRVWFDQLLPHLGKFVRNRVLVPAGSDDATEVRAQFESGAVVGEWTIVRCINLVEDTELYEVRGGAMKIARFASREMQSVFENEGEILRHLDGSIAPRLLASGLYDERPCVVMEWVPGVDASVAATQRRHDRPALLDLCASIAEAYAELHARGVVHADVHAKNILVGDRVQLVDFGFSRFADREPRLPRGGMYTFFEPEYFASGVHSSPAGEQYSLAALLYYLIARAHYVDFKFDREEMIRQVREDAPLPLAQRGVSPWPEVEALLSRALSKDPAARFSSMRAFAALLRTAADAAARDALAAPLSQSLLDTTLASFARGGAMFASRYTVAPTASITFGAAGAAVGLLRIAETRGDAALLALADVWRSRASALIDDERAFFNDRLNLARKDLGEISPYHTESGVHAAGAMIAYAMGDARSLRRAVHAFLHASQRPCNELDLTLGRSGSLLAASLLLPLHADPALRAFGSSTLQEIWTALDARPPIASSPHGTFLGMAHGWAGYLYTTLRWCFASGDALPAQLVERLHQLAALRVAQGRGAWWPRIIGKDHHLPGWCNGSAGHVFLFTLAAHIDPHFLAVAELAAWHTWEEPRGLTSLCCGTAGRAYALLALYKHTGSREWLARARSLANHAADAATATTQHGNSLWRGELGVATLIADLASPENARMPFFE